MNELTFPIYLALAVYGLIGLHLTYLFVKRRTRRKLNRYDEL